jgi:MFS family permease
VDTRRPSLLLLVIIYFGFFSLGLPDGSFGVAWPAMHPELGLPIGLAGTITTVVTLLSALSGFAGGAVIARFRTGPVALVSCALTGLALVAIAQARGAGWLFVAAVPLGLGAGAVDTGLNGFVARHYSARHMNWLHACWGGGALCGPLIMGATLANADGWRDGYRLIGATQLALAAVLLLSLRLWRNVPERTGPESAGGTAEQRPTLLASSFAGWLSVVLFVVYAAVEATLGVWAGSILVSGRGFSPATAAFAAAAFYGAIALGRVLIGFVVERWGNRRLVTAGTGLALVGCGLFALSASPLLAAGALLLTGLGLAPVYPCLMHEAPNRFAPEAAPVVIGRQSGAAYLGAAFLPAAAGLLAAHSLAGIPWLVAGGIGVLILGIRALDRMS